jgi:hypothetical protein
MSPEEEQKFVDWFKDNQHRKGTPDWDRMVGIFRQMDVPDEPDVFGDMAAQASEGLDRGLYNFLNFPTSLANLGLAGADLAAEQFGGGVDFRFQRPGATFDPESMLGKIHARYSRDTPAQTKMGEYTERAGEFLGEDIPLALTGLGIAKPLAAAAKPGVVKQMAEGILNTPGQMLRSEGIASTGAAIGSKAAEDAGLGPVGQIVGGLAGGVTPSLYSKTPGPQVTRWVGDKLGRMKDLPLEQLHDAKRARTRKDAGKRQTARDWVGGRAIDRREARARDVGKTRAHGYLNEIIDEDAVKRAQETIELKEFINEGIPEGQYKYQPTLAEAIESPALLGEQQRIAASRTGADFDRLHKGTIANERLMMDRANEIVPEGRIEDIVEPLEMRVAGKREQIARIGENLQTREQQILQRLEQADTRGARGRVIRDSIMARKAAMKEDMSTLADRLGLNSNPARIAATDVRNEMKGYIDSIPDIAGDLLPPDLVSDIKKIKPGTNWGIEQLQALRTRISDEIRRAGAESSRYRYERPLNELLKRFDAASSAALEKSVDPGLADRWASYRETYKREYVQRFKQGAVADVLQKKDTGEFKIKSEAVADTLFGAGKESAGEDVLRVLSGDDLPGMEALEAAATDSLYHAAFDPASGSIRPGAIERWRAKHADVLQKFPEISANATDAETALRRLNDRRGVLAQREKAFNQDRLVKDITAVSGPGAKMPDAIMTDALKDPRKMKALWKTVTDPASRDAIKRLAWNDALETGVFKETSLYPFSDNEQASLKMLLEGMRKNNLIKPPSRGRMPKPDVLAAMEDQFGVSIDQFFNRWFQVESGRVSGRTTTVNLLGKMSRRTQGKLADRFFEQLVNDPEMAATVARGMSRALTPPEVKRLGTWMVVNGLAPFEEEYNPLRVPVNPMAPSRTGGE